MYMSGKERQEQYFFKNQQIFTFWSIWPFRFHLHHLIYSHKEFIKMAYTLFIGGVS